VEERKGKGMTTGQINPLVGKGIQEKKVKILEFIIHYEHYHNVQ
jgi:hypothetical protein